VYVGIPAEVVGEEVQAGPSRPHPSV